MVSGAVTLASGADGAGADDIGFALMPPLGTMAGKGRMPEIGGKHSKVTTARRARHGSPFLGTTIRVAAVSPWPRPQKRGLPEVYKDSDLTRASEEGGELGTMRGARLGRMQLLLVLALAMLPVSTTFSLLPATQAPSCPGLATCPKRLLLAARARPGRAQWQAMAAGDSEGGEADPVPISGADWRQFRARLVAQEKGDRVEDIQAGDGWAYETGNMVENGSLLLGGSELEFTFGLRQQYFHKCVMLVLSHTKDFTKGIIVNRPTSRRTAGGWRIWYGGDVQGINAPAAMQEAVCLHKSSAEAVVEVSEPVIKGIYTCSLEAAEKLVEDGKAQPEDFWLLMGYAGWAPGQLQMEIDARSSWHVAAASPVLLSELIAQAADSKTAEAGISVWETLMAKIGLADKAAKVSGSFEDRMLREWAREHVTKDPLVLKSEAMDNLLRAASRRSLRGADRGTPVGTMLRTSPTSPYILEQQVSAQSRIALALDRNIGRDRLRAIVMTFF